MASAQGSTRRHREASAGVLVSVDLAIFSLRQDSLQVLLARRPDREGEPFPGQWALPGGFVDPGLDEDLIASARRSLLRKTGFSTHYLEQLGSWGSRSRDPRGWSTTHVYFALVPTAQDEAPDNPASRGSTPGGSAEAAWMPVDKALRQSLAFDHKMLLQQALARLRGKVEYTNLAAFLLPEPFTLPQLQEVFERVLDRPLDKSAFRKRMLDGEFLREAGPVPGHSGRSAMGYSIRDRGEVTVFPRPFKSGE